LLGAFSARRAQPHLFIFDLGETEGRLPDELAHAEGSHPVPGANRVAHSALIAELESVSAVLFDDVYDLFEGGYSFHRFP